MADIRAVVVDDEPLARRGVRQLASAHADVIVVGEAADGPEAVRVIRTLLPDLVFLDVQMPGLDGFDVLMHEIERAPAVVFVTAYEEFALRAFEVDAVDYLLKPVPAERFAVCMERVRARLATAPGRDAPPTVVAVRVRGGERLLHPEEIDWIEADDYYAVIHSGGRRFLVRESLASLADRLPAHLFMRVHRSAVVNLSRVRAVLPAEGGGGALVLRGGARVPVGRRNRSAVLERLRGRGLGPARHG